MTGAPEGFTAPEAHAAVAAFPRGPQPDRPILAVTIGDIAGIGPEVTVRAITTEAVRAQCLPLVIGHPEIFRRAVALSGLSSSPRLLAGIPRTSGELRNRVLELEADGFVACLDPFGEAALSAPTCRVSGVAGDAAFHYLTQAIQLAQARLVAGIVTAPLNKEALHLAGHHYPGHTEILAEQCGVVQYAMMLHLSESRIGRLRQLVHSPDELACGGDPLEVRHGLSIAHVTLHTSIASVPGLLTTAEIIEKIELMHGFLQRTGCRRSAIAVAALNPHAGEQGLFGDEEIRLIAPAVEAMRSAGMCITGPLPADTLIRRAFGGEFDGVVAMYHDQGHIPVKLLGFDAAVNITLGLPLVRTSPTHGTAFDRAWNESTPASPSGMIEAILMAARLAAPLP